MPLDFLRIPLIALIGWWLYNEKLDMFVFAGAGLIITGVLWNLRSEATRSRNIRRGLRNRRPGAPRRASEISRWCAFSGPAYSTLWSPFQRLIRQSGFGRAPFMTGTAILTIVARMGRRDCRCSGLRDAGAAHAPQHSAAILSCAAARDVRAQSGLPAL